MVKAFHLFDQDNLGRISLANLTRVAKEVGEDLSEPELRAMLQEADRNGDGFLDQQEFLAVLQRSSMF